MLRVFLDVVLPVFLVAVLGGIVGRWRNIPISSISSLVFYLFTPSLVFYSLSTTEVSAGDAGRILAVMLFTFGCMFVASNVWSLVRRHDSPMRAAVALGATTPNVGNMGLPVSQLAFGNAGLDVAVMCFVIGSVMANSVGIAIGSMAGSGSKREALRAPLRFPALYAAILGVIVNVSGVDLPVAIESPARSLAGAAVPTMLVVLGLQLRHAGGTEFLADTVAVNLARLLLAPGSAIVACILLGLEGISRDALIVSAAMPTAVIATIVATEFKANPAFVTRIVVTTTLASMASLSVLISLL
jgi:malate permease and related proteins